MQQYQFKTKWIIGFKGLRDGFCFKYEDISSNLCLYKM